jgi:hypothetical protein
MPHRGPVAWHVGLDQATLDRIEALIVESGGTDYSGMVAQLHKEGIDVSRSALNRYGQSLLQEIKIGEFRHKINRRLKNPDFRKRLLAYGAAMLEQQLLLSELESMLIKSGKTNATDQADAY